MRLTATYRPREAWAAIRCPVFLIWGERDERVSVPTSQRNITATLEGAGNTHVTVRVYDRADHNFRIVDPPPGDGWEHRVPGFVDTVISWAQTASLPALQGRSD